LFGMGCGGPVARIANKVPSYAGGDRSLL